MIGFLQHLIDALALGSIYALTALGIGLLFGILRLINFAHGDLITVGAYALIVPAADVTARLLIGSWTPAAVVIAVSVIVVVAALLTDAAVFRPLRTASPPTLMIAYCGCTASRNASLDDVSLPWWATFNTVAPTPAPLRRSTGRS